MLLLLTRGGLPIAYLPDPQRVPGWRLFFVPTLTDKFVRSARGGEHTDEGQRGLILLVRPSTSKLRPDELRRSWVLRAVHAGKRSVSVSANIPPSVSLKRVEGAEAIRLLEKGRTPRKAAPGRKPRSRPRPTRSSGGRRYLASRADAQTPRAKPPARAASRRSVRISTTGWSRRLDPRDCDHPGIARARTPINPHRAQRRTRVRGCRDESRGVLMRTPCHPIF